METETTKGVRLVDLRRTSCRWPLGEMFDHVEFFCGEPTAPGCSWCAKHRKLAFHRTVSQAPKKPMALKDRR